MKVYEAGQRLRDANYGAGVVLTADSEYTTIRFRQHGVKKFVTSLLKMEEEEEGRAKTAATPERPHDAAARKIRTAREAEASTAGKPARSLKRTHPVPRRTSRHGGSPRRRVRAVRRARTKRRPASGRRR